MAEAFDKMKGAIGLYDQAGETLKNVPDYDGARQIASTYPRSMGDNTAADALLDPDRTTSEQAIRGLKLSRNKQKESLEELLKNDFDGALDDPDVKEERLKQSLINYLPRKDVGGNSQKLSNAHKIYRNIELYSARNQIDLSPKDVQSILAEMTKEIVERYDSLFKIESSDDDELKSHKQAARSFFLSIYIDKDGKPKGEGENIADKYKEIHNDELREFNEKLSSKSSLVKYIIDTLPENVDQKMNLLRTIAA